MTVSGEVDFSLDSFGVSNERMEVADYLLFLKGGAGRLYTRNPADGYDWGVYTFPFTLWAWIGFDLFCFFMPFLLMCLMFDCAYIEIYLK